MTDELLHLAAEIDGEPAPVDIGMPENQPQAVGSNQPPPGHVPNPEIIMALQSIVTVSGAGLAGYFNADHWNVDPDQSKAVAISIDAVLEKYLHGNYAMPPELTLLLTLAIVFGPKYKQQIELKKNEKPKAKSVEAEPTLSVPSDDGIREIDGVESEPAI
jgi:hypothetical protein